ncbi:hypothetical protein Hanom_Chr07g00620971 [Helianthus anomalus]
MKILSSWFFFLAFIGILQHSSRDVDVDAGDCDIVQVIENNGDILKLLRLTHVGGGYKSVFKGGDRVVEIPIDESHRFIYQPPAVRLTDEQNGRLRGYWWVTQGTQEQSQLDKHRKQVQRLANKMVMHQGMEADLYLRQSGFSEELKTKADHVCSRYEHPAREMNKRKEGMPGEARAAALLRRYVRENR